ncbi:putative histidine kinase-like ATPase domain-containing protein [Lupinus albus]|uniref:Putative histidine kinase-like ATPase domain-containing protein n=1 Tax=Lupinus albus TaxID=3870 RepID=A0A6A4PM82_LUPAL|nr:putative histidine kinase-like ATPase domain-containing protein [Lupinus albus]
MSEIEIVDLCSDDEGGQVGHSGSDFVSCAKQQNETSKGQQCHSTCQDYDKNISFNGPSTCHRYSGLVEPGLLPDDDIGLSYSSPICETPLCRMFWKAGTYDNGPGSKIQIQNADNYLHVHPLFLHSNSTSHKWAFGAIAELLDNAVDEIQNGATFVILDKISNPKDGSPALLIQDDGGGMDPEAMRRCMSFGFSEKMSKVAVGRYGNGFKTGTMRLGADAIVFSHHLNNRIMTQSIGLLSYTFLMRTKLHRIVVPMVSYEFNTSSGSFKILNGEEHFLSNLSILLHWSPYSSEKELLDQFLDIGSHGTKIILFNLWDNDDGNLELDFDTDQEDIHIAGNIKKVGKVPTWKTVNEQHFANRFRYSLRVYLSILYLRIPESFKIILRGQVVKLRNIADDLKYIQYILYRPQSCNSEEATVVTTIGFLKEAPEVSIQGFNIYHKNRLILPFWQVANNKVRGVVGILHADFVEPTHNKQDFERTSLFQKLEVRLRQMTMEYWCYHCHLIGYREMKPRAQSSPLEASLQKSLGIEKPVAFNKSFSPVLLPHTQSSSDQGNRVCEAICFTPSLTRFIQLMVCHCVVGSASLTKRNAHGLTDLLKLKRQRTEENVTGVGCNQNSQTVAYPADQVVDQQAIKLMQVNKKLHADCLKYESAEEELNHKVMHLRIKIEEAKHERNRLFTEIQSLDIM